MTEAEDRELLRDLLERRGVDFVNSIFQSHSTDWSLTVVSNAGMHPLPTELIVGELYVASEGSLDFTSIETVNKEYDKVIRALHAKLNEKQWQQVYLFPFGHSTLCMNIKLAVYRILRIETVDFFYFGNGKYGKLVRDTREVITSE